MLNIIVTDGSHTSDCSLNISITDINDNDPVFVDPKQFTVSEAAEIGEAIGTVNVR